MPKTKRLVRKLRPKLGPGKYRALLKITDTAGNVSSTETLRFRVLKRKGKG